MWKKITFLLLLVLAFDIYVSKAQEDPNKATPNLKTFTMGTNNSGVGANTVNLFTGDVNYPLSLVSIPGQNGLDINVNLSYTSNVQNQVGLWNLEAPTSIVGLGWSLDMPKIVADNKQTAARDDDEFYLIEGGANKLICTDATSSGIYRTYVLKSYQFWQIKYYFNDEKWEIIKQDGTRYIYGDQNSNRNTTQWVVTWSNWIGHSNMITGQSRQAQIWNLSEIINQWNQKITFEYEAVEQAVGSTSGLKHTEASYIKKISNDLGRKVEFFYKEKTSISNNLIQEPHIEQVEPDAYQEFYERKYLDYLEVVKEDGSKQLSIDLTYSTLDAGTTYEKLLLTEVTQISFTGTSIPAQKFEYFSADNMASGEKKGFLKKITLPTGGTISYKYQTANNTNQLARSHRSLQINAPSGYGNPKTYVADDYVVVCWREGTGTQIWGTTGKKVKIYVYSWLGEWKETYITEVSGIPFVSQPTLGGNYEPSQKDYPNFFLQTEKNFFAFTYPTPNTTSTTYAIHIVTKDDLTRGKWNYSLSNSHPVGTGTPSLVIGTNYVALASYSQGNVYMYTYRGYSGWGPVQTLNWGADDSHNIGTNNYFIRQIYVNRNPDHFRFNFLGEDKIWKTRYVSSSTQLFETNSPSIWSLGNSFATVFAGSSTGYSIHWDKDYNNINKKSGLGTYINDQRVFFINNTTVGRAYYTYSMHRYNGDSWISFGSLTPSSTNGDFGDDYALWYNDDDFYLKEFDPNLNQAKNTQFLGNFPESGFLSKKRAGYDWLVAKNVLFTRNNAGVWSQIPNYVIDNSQYSVNPTVAGKDVILIQSNLIVPRVQLLKNGQPYGTQIQVSENFSNNIGFSRLVGINTFITINQAYLCDANTLVLHRVVNDDIQNQQVDYPVSQIIVNDGSQDTYTSIVYDFSSATIDPSGNLAQYNKVTVIPGNDINLKPEGYTITKFHNGLTNTDIAGLPAQSDLMWNGSPYLTQVFDKDNNEVANNQTNLFTFSKVIKNTLNEQVDVAFFVKASSTTNKKDGAETLMAFTYNDYGEIKEEQIWNIDSKNTNLTSNQKLKTSYRYLCEESTDALSKNILNATIQVKKEKILVDGSTLALESTATTWQQWSGVWAPHKSYVWRRTGSAEFDFVNGSGTNEPSPSIWTKTNQIVMIDTRGNVLEVRTR